MTSKGSEPVLVFFSYTHKDEALRDELAVHLAMLKREGTISEWHDRRIGAGQEWAGEIDANLEAAHTILLLVSPDFLASDYCYDIEVRAAMRRHEAGEARVIPVILRPCDWSRAPFSKLQGLPKDAKPVTLWPNRDEAFLDVAKGIRRVAEEMVAVVLPAPLAEIPPKSAVSTSIPRSPAIGFVSRRDEHGRDILERLREELSPERGRLVALWGPGGSGKTTLAAEVVRALSASFPNWIVWTSALGRPDFTLSTLLDDIATQLGRPELRQKGMDDKEAEVRALIASAPTLVILDNLEAIARGDADEQVRCLDFLTGCGECPALLTTRDFVGRPEVVNVRLAAMEEDEAREFLNRLIERSGRPEAFQGLDRDELISECEANPLVTQWVVSRVALAQRVGDVLADLKHGEGDAAERVFERSFMLPQIGEDGRAALLNLSLFAPDASREALSYVSGFGDDLRRLDRAVERLSALWLVETTEGHERLLLRGLTRELTRSRLSRDERTLNFHNRFISFFVAYAVEHSNPSPENYDSLEAEKDNLISAAELAFALQDWRSLRTIAFTCGLPLDGVLSIRGFWSEAIKLNELALRAARVSNQQELVANSAHNLGVLYQMRGEWAEARGLYEESRDIYQSLSDERRFALTLHNLAAIAAKLGDLGEARRLYHDSLQISRRVGEQEGIANTLHNLANLALASGDLDEARDLYQESFDLAKKLGNQRRIANSLHQLGRLAQTKGLFDEARRFYAGSLSIERRMRNRAGEALSLAQLALLDAAEGKLGDAIEHSQHAEDIMLQLGNQDNISRISGQRKRFEARLRKQDSASLEKTPEGDDGDLQR